jgi:hypothetical protein
VLQVNQCQDAAMKLQKKCLACTGFWLGNSVSIGWVQDGAININQCCLMLLDAG